MNNGHAQAPWTRLHWTASAVLAGRLSAPVLNLVLVVLLARLGGAAVLGGYTFLVTAYVLIEQAKTLGLQSLVVREMAGDAVRAAHCRAALVRIGLLGAAVGSPLLVVAGWLFEPSADVVRAAAIMTIGLFASAWTVANDGFLLARERAWAGTAVTIGENAGRALLSAAVLVWHGPSLPALALVYSATRVAAAVAQRACLPGDARRTRAPHGSAHALLRQAGPFFVIFVGPQLLFRMDLIILGFMCSSVEVGVYSAAVRFVAVAMLVPDALLAATYVRLSRLAKAGDAAGVRALFRRTLVTLSPLVPAAALAAALAPALMPLVFGPEYQASGRLLQVLVWAPLPFALARAFGDLLTANGLEARVARSVMMTVIIGVPVYIGLIAAFGALGAACAFVATAVFLCGAAGRELARRSSLRVFRTGAVAAALLLAAVLGTACAPAAGAPPAASITVRPSAPVARISPLIYGAAVEWTEHGNRILDPQRGVLREDVLALLTPLRIPVWRFPGGILADYYDWRDGVGPRASRPVRVHPMDGSQQSNAFGTDEFIEFCRRLNADALITANFGTGRAADAVAWQAYFRERRFPVRFWEIGNEIYLTEPVTRSSIPGNDARIFHTGEDYSRQFGEWARGLRQGDSAALVGAIAGTFNTGSRHRRWIYDLLGRGGRDIDFIALHNSFAPIITSRWDYASADRRRAAYQAMIAHAEAVARDVRGVTKGFTESGPRSEPRIAITEHFPLFGMGGPQLNEVLDQSRTLAAGLYTASLFHVWMRERVWMANYNLAVSRWFGALVTDTDAGLIRTPTYHVYDLYRNHFGDTLVETTASGPTFSTRATGTVAAARNVPVLDAVASTTADGTVCLSVINRRFDAAQEARLAVDGIQPGARADVLTIAADAPNAINGPALTKTVSPGDAQRVAIRTSSWSTSPSYAFPPHSITMFRWPRARPSTSPIRRDGP